MNVNNRTNLNDSVYIRNEVKSIQEKLHLPRTYRNKSCITILCISINNKVDQKTEQNVNDPNICYLNLKVQRNNSIIKIKTIYEQRISIILHSINYK